MKPLVFWVVFDSIEVAFVPVGHTQESIDQAFIKTSNCLRGKDAIISANFYSSLQNIFDGPVKVVYVKGIKKRSGLCNRGNVLNGENQVLQYS